MMPNASGRLAADYRQALDDKRSVLVVSPTHAESRAITAAIRQELRQAGRLQGDDREFTRLVQVDTSEAQRGKASTYQPGDVIQFHQNAKGGFTKGDRLTVADPAAVPVEHAGKFSLYRPQAIGLAAGDRVRFTSNVGTLRRQAYPEKRHGAHRGGLHAEGYPARQRLDYPGIGRAFPAWFRGNQLRKPGADGATGHPGHCRLPPFQL